MQHTYTTVADIVLRDTDVVPAGSVLRVTWSDTPAGVQLVTWADAPGGERILRLKGRSIGRALAGEVPSPDQLEEWTFDSVCETPTGDEVEPDGYGQDGCPSWLLLLGMV